MVGTVILLIASVFGVIASSRPRNRKFSVWINSIRRECSNLRRKNDHVKAAVLLRIIDRKVIKYATNFIGGIVSGFGNFKDMGASAEGWIVFGLFSPFIGLMFLGKNYSNPLFFYSSVWFIFFLLFLYYFYHFTTTKLEPVQALDSGRQYLRVKNRLNKLTLLLFPINTLFGLRHRLLRISGSLEICVRQVAPHVVLSMSLTSIAIFILIHKLCRNYLDLPPYVFYPLASLLGPLFFLFVGFLIFLACQLPFFFSQSDPVDKKFMRKITRGAIYLSITTSLTFLLYYTSRYDTSVYFDTRSVWLVYTNIVCDIYVIYLFNNLMLGISRTRRASNQYSLLIIREYILFFVRSFVASAISIYIGFYFSDTPLTILGTARLFVGLDPFGEGIYVGSVFWLVHTALLPAFLIVTVPITFIIARLWKLLIHRFVVSAIRNGNPAMYIMSLLIFLGTALQLSSQFMDS